MPWVTLGEWKSKYRIKKKRKDGEGNEMKEKSQRGEHGEIKG